jgi:hypothetical protein
VLSREATNINLIVFGLTRPRLKPDHGFEPWSGGVMVGMLPLSEVDHGFEPWSGGVMVGLLPLSEVDHGFINVFIINLSCN